MRTGDLFHLIADSECSFSLSQAPSHDFVNDRMRLEPIPRGVR